MGLFESRGGTIVFRIRGFHGEVYSRVAQSSHYSLTPHVACFKVKTFMMRRKEDDEQDPSP